MCTFLRDSPVQRPFGGFIVAILVISTRPRHFERLKLDIAHGSNFLHNCLRYLSGHAGSEPFLVIFIGIGKGSDVVGSGRRSDLMGIFIKL